MTVETSYRATAAQLALRRLIADKTRVLAYGGSRSGKTFEFCRTMIAIGLRYGGRSALFRRYFSSAKNSAFNDTFPKALELAFPGLEYRRNLNETRIWLPHNGAEFWFVGLDDRRRAEKILGLEFSTVYFNECSEISFESVELALTRLAELRTDENGKLLRNRAFFDCNPSGKSHWTYRMFIEKLDPRTNLPLPDPENYGAMQINPVDNVENLPKGYIESTLGGGSEQMKRRFLLGEFANDAPDALWKQSVIDANRRFDPPNDLDRVVVAVDPAMTGGPDSDLTGIVVVGKRRELDGRDHFYVLDDRSLRAEPPRWASEIAEAFRYWDADRVVVEVNQGGDLVAGAIRQIDPNLPISTVRATRGKVVRAEPIVVPYERGRAHHVGVFRELEDQMTSFVQGARVGQGDDRVDALVWAITFLSDREGSCDGGFVTF
ncbi:MAG: phage terminase large subunit [Thermoguttaceae bacterium]|nr:phage terminase large subunit [Thermoguttaceae bacterium]